LTTFKTFSFDTLPLDNTIPGVTTRQFSTLVLFRHRNCWKTTNAWKRFPSNGTPWKRNFARSVIWLGGGKVVDCDDICRVARTFNLQRMRQERPFHRVPAGS